MTLSDPSEPPAFALKPRLAICVTCKAGLQTDDGELRPGRRLHEALAERCGEDGPVDLTPVECLSLCERGCSAAISMTGKWSYLLGGLDAAMADDLLTYARAYAVSRTGLVLPSKRPASLAAMVMGRIPPTAG